MAHARSIANLEADLAALRATAERAGTALACLFSTSDEFEAEVIRMRHEQGIDDIAKDKTPRRLLLRAAALVAAVALVVILF